jgi:hypothetical protein
MSDNILSDSNEATLQVSPQQKKKRILALVGAGLMLVGVFLPIVSLPIVGSVNYFNNGRGDGLIVIILAAVATVLALTKNYRFLPLPGIAALALMSYTLFNLISGLTTARSEMEKSLANNPFRGIGDALLSSVQVQWGWLPLIVGAFLVTAAGLLPHEMVKEDGTPGPAPNYRSAYLILGGFACLFFAAIIVAAYVPLGIKMPSYSQNSAATNSPFATSSTSTSSTSSSSATTKPSPADDAEKSAYIPKIAISKVEVGKSILDEVGVFGELKNTGDRTLSRVEITIYFLDKAGQPIYEKNYSAVLVSDYAYGDQGKPLKPGYSQKFGVKADDAPSEWDRKVNVKVTDIEFAK